MSQFTEEEKDALRDLLKHKQALEDMAKLQESKAILRATYGKFIITLAALVTAFAILYDRIETWVASR